MKTDTHIRIVKYLFAGGFATGLNLLLLYCFTEFLHIYYLLSAVGAFLVSFAFSFILQKYWTFKNRSINRARSQAAKYFLMQVSNLALNTTLLYTLVEYGHIWYIFAQAIVSLVLAIVTFFISQRFIFTHDPAQ